MKKSISVVLALTLGTGLTWLAIEALSSPPSRAAEAKPANWNDNAPAFIEAGSAVSDYSKVKVTMPAPIAAGQHPCIYLTHDEIGQMRQEMAQSDRGKAALKAVLDTTEPWLNKKIVMPDPNLPAQLKDRGDAAAGAHDTLCNACGRLGWAYQLTGDERYAAKAREILLGYAGLYVNGYKEHRGVNRDDTGKIMAQRLSEAMLMLPLIQSYDMIYNAKCMTDADRKKIEQGLIQPALTFINDKRSAAATVRQRDRNPNWRTADPGPGQPQGNWTNFYNAAYIQGGLAMGDQNWVDIGAANTCLNIAQGIGDDGMWKEGAIGYQFFARQALVGCLEPLARHGIDLYSFEKCRVKNLWDSPYKYAYPDGTAPGINDSSRVAIGGDYLAGAYDYAWLRYHDPNYGKAVNDAPRQIIQSEGVYYPTIIYQKLPEQPLAGIGSLFFQTLGYAIMRGTDGGSPTFLLLNCGMDAGPHDHPEKLDLLIYADNDELTGEPVFYRYEDKRHEDWTVPTIAHFCMAVDQKSQMHTSGTRLMGFYDAGDVKVMRGVCDTAYVGVGLDRTVVQMPGYIVDVFRGHGSAQHTYDYPICFRGNADALAGVAPASLKPMSDNLPGYDCIDALAPVKVDGNWDCTWTRQATDAAPANRVKVTVVGDPGTLVSAGRDVDGRDRILIRRQGNDAVFASIINPYKSEEVVKSVEQMKLDGPVAGYGLKVTRTDGGTDLILIRFDPEMDNKLAGASKFDGGMTDAETCVIRLDGTGKLIEAGFVGGTTLTGPGGANLSALAPGIKWQK